MKWIVNMNYSQQWLNVNKIGTYTINGESTAGMRTSFYLKELKILLDAGHQCYYKVQDIFITHTHADHIASLPLIILENISNKLITRIYCLDESIKYLSRMVDCFLSCNYHNDYIPKKYYKFIGVKVGVNLELKLNNNNIIVEVFESDHRVPTVSYGFSEVKKKIKDEYKDLSSNEIVELKKNNVEITNEVIFKKFLFCGDTTINIFANPNILTYPDIIIECTYFEDIDIDSAASKKHMHWYDLRQVISKNPQIIFNIIHISAKYKNMVFSNIIETTNVKLL